MLKVRIRPWVFALGLGLGHVLPAAAQAPAPSAKPDRTAEAWTLDQPPPAAAAAAVGPEQPVQNLPQPDWVDVGTLTDDDIESHSRQLKAARAARVRGLAKVGEEIAQIQDRLSKTGSETQRRKLEYRRALLNFRMAMEERQVRLISARLDTLSRERARRRSGSAEEVPDDPTALSNVRQVKAAVEMLDQYDKALARVLRREPVTESDVIYALGLLNEKARLSKMVNDYMALLENRATGKAGAATPESATGQP